MYKVICGKCGDEMKSIDITIAGQIFACAGHGSGFIAYYEIDRAIAEALAGAPAEMVLTPYMSRVR